MLNPQPTIHTPQNTDDLRAFPNVLELNSWDFKGLIAIYNFTVQEDGYML